jgi:lipid II:glycine glycyltransferase (peptidoglycan interpeptide bridge formation enzyme)
MTQLTINLSTEELIAFSKVSREELKRLLQKGMNTFEQASPELHNFCDLVISGEVL